MAANMKQKEITTRQVASIQFGMYTDEEVRFVGVGWRWGRSTRRRQQQSLAMRAAHTQQVVREWCH